MSDQIAVDRAELEDVYVQMDDALARTRLRRIFQQNDEHIFDHDTEDTVEQARAEGFAAGMFMAGLASMGTFEEEAEEPSEDRGFGVTD